MPTIKRILITGAAGYTGSNLVHYLLSQHFLIFSLIRKTTDVKKIKKLEKFSTCVYGDDFHSIKKILEENQIDCVIHLAAIAKYDYHSEEIDEMINGNFRLGVVTLEAMSKSNCKKFINFGTYWQNNEQGQPVCLYAALKQAFEDILKLYSRDQEINFISLRFTDICGENDTRPKILTQLKNQPKNIPLPISLGEQEINLIHLEDAMSAVKNALEIIDNSKYNNSIYYACGNETFTLKEIVNIYQKQTGKNLEIDWGKLPYRKNQIMKLQLDKKLPNFKAIHNIAQIIKLYE